MEQRAHDGEVTNAPGADRRRVLAISVLIMTLVAVAVGAIFLIQLYRTAFEQQRGRLVEITQSRARLIEAMTRFDEQYSADNVPSGAWAAALSQIEDAHSRFSGFGETGEFTLARREGDQIVFLLSHRHELESPQPISFTSERAEPMRRALLGQSGTVVGLDYRGATVLAAHEPLAGLELGIVAKIDLAEIRAPFVRTGITASVGALVIVVLGIGLTLFGINPLIRKTEQRTTQLAQANDRLTREMDQREQAQLELTELARTLEQRVTVRTAELEASRTAALNMMQDGEEARRKAEAALAERKRAEQLLRDRTLQQTAVAELGSYALAGTDLNALFGEAVRRVASTLGVEYCKVLELLPGGDELLLRAGIGWKEGYVGRARVDTDMNSQAGYTLSVDKPVLVDDLREETRFKGPALLLEHGVVSGVSVAIPGDKAPFGVLGAHTSTRRQFTAEEGSFLQSVANILADAIEQRLADETIRRMYLSLERRVAERTAELETANKELEAFTYSVSHDLKQPLRAIDGYAHMLQEKSADRLDAEGRRQLDRIHTATARMGQLIEDLLALSQVGRAELQPGAIDTGELVKTVYEELKSEAAERRITVRRLPATPLRRRVSWHRRRPRHRAAYH